MVNQNRFGKRNSSCVNCGSAPQIARPNTGPAQAGAGSRALNPMRTASRPQAPQVLSNLRAPMSRGSFLRTAGIGAAGVAAAGLGLGGVARAAAFPAGNDNPDPANIIDPSTGQGAIGGESEIWIYPTGNDSILAEKNPIANNAAMTTDSRNIQWAVNNIQENGTILLKNSSTQFHFPKLFQYGFAQVIVWRSCTVSGETDQYNTGNRLPDGTPQFPNGMPLTIIRNGGMLLDLRTLLSNNPPISVTVKNLHFDGAQTHVLRTHYNGDFVIDNCKVTNLLLDYTSGLNIPNLVSIFSVQYTNPASSFIGSFTVKNCDINQPNPAKPGTIDMGIMYNSQSPGNRAANVAILNNTINVKGVAIINAYNYKTNTNVTPQTIIRNNHIIIDGANSQSTNNNAAPIGIFIADSKYNTVSGNLMEGVSRYGILVYSDAPTINSSDNNFFGNDLSNLTAKVAQVYLDKYSKSNYFGAWDDQVTGQSYPNNAYGPILPGPSALGAFMIYGTGNTINLDDFTRCAVPGWYATPAVGCIALYGSGNQVYEHPRLGVKYFPPGTDLCNQVMEKDLGANMIYQWDKLCIGGGLPNDKFAEIIQKLEQHAQFMAENEPPYGQAEGWPPEQ
ncbi:right-handed parallel beta-helix repeat-containing protein [Candidatus Micrarchaeota archaeon]|nr:right-handed parallel beta-helix repeat-containing protein [Candidatus Micrarchaeota archaeon]